MTNLIIFIAVLALIIALSQISRLARRKVAAQFNGLLAQQVNMALTLSGYTQGKQGWIKPGCKGAVRVEIATNATTGKVRVALTETLSGKGVSTVLDGNVLVLADQLAMQDQAREFVMQGCQELITPALDVKAAGRKLLAGLDRLERKLFPGIKGGAR